MILLKTAAEMRELSNEVNRHQRKRDDIYQEIMTRIYFAAKTGMISCNVKLYFQNHEEHNMIEIIVEDLHSKGYIAVKQLTSDTSCILFISW